MLTWKLQQWGGMGGKGIEWMKKYLTGREMRMLIRRKIKLKESREWFLKA